MDYNTPIEVSQLGVDFELFRLDLARVSGVIEDTLNIILQVDGTVGKGFEESDVM